MKRIAMMILVVLCGACGFVPGEASSAESDGKTIALPAPQKSGGMPLMEALALRSSNRNFDAAKPLSDQTLSDLLWAAWGVNRPDGRRTAPTAKNTQAIQLYAAMENGVWLYDAPENKLSRVLGDDTRAKFGGAPLALLYAAPAEDVVSGMHAGSLYQNAGLFCASAGLANVVKTTGINALDGILTLPAGYRVFVVQSIGWPK